MQDIRKMLRIYLTDAGVIVHILLVVSAIAVSLSSLTWEVLAIVPIGWVSYVVQEHLVHRYVFHAPAPRSQFLFNLYYRLHCGHHDQIHNSELLFTPLWFSLPLGLLNVAVVSLILPINQAFVLVYLGAVSAYLLFEWCHLLSHFHAHNRGAYATRLTRDHGRHHHINFRFWFTVSPGGQMVDSALGANPHTFSRLSYPRTCGLCPDDPRLSTVRQKYTANQVLANRTPVTG